MGKMIFLYKIINKAGNTISFTCNTEHAEKRSRSGDVVYGYAKPENHKIRREVI